MLFHYGKNIQNAKMHLCSFFRDSNIMYNGNKIFCFDYSKYKLLHIKIVIKISN